jgi:DNA-directed RNA polymerase subunit RPC12/RpoP
MKINMQILEGPDPDEKYTFPLEGEPEDEGTNILVGRDDVSCEAHWRLGKKDLYVSRAHFVLEVRPPNCYLQDVMSKNGTFLLRENEPEKRVENEILEDGDRIRVGETILGFVIETEKPIGTIVHPTPFVSHLYPEEEKEPAIELFCIRCGKQLKELPSIIGSMRDMDFMCDRCQTEVAEERRQEAEEKAEVKYACFNCDADVTTRANWDGRAAELSEVALYFCINCMQETISENKYRSFRLPKGDYGGYTLIHSLGRGGMGEVFKAVHSKTGRIAAIKQALPIANSDEGTMGRFYREISLMQRVIHPNLVRLYEAGQVEEKPYFISEFVPGGDMSQFIDDDGNPTIDPKKAAEIISDSLVGLDYFHRGEDGTEYLRIHRDLKPENILIQQENGKVVPKVADFGLSKSYEDAGGVKTKTGEFAGTWMYMPPEQITNFKRCTHLVDVYAMGVTLYYLLSGHSPLENLPAPWEIKKKGGKIVLKKTPAQMVVHDERIPLAKSRAGLPEGLYTIVDQAVSKKAVDRQKGAEVLRQMIIKTFT